MLNELLSLQPLTLARITHQLDSFLRAVSGAESTAHAGATIRLSNPSSTAAAYPDEAVIGVPLRCASIAPEQHEQQLQMA